jgi:hypothetical protein
VTEGAKSPSAQARKSVRGGCRGTSERARGAEACECRRDARSPRCDELAAGGKRRISSRQSIFRFSRLRPSTESDSRRALIQGIISETPAIRWRPDESPRMRLRLHSQLALYSPVTSE